MTPKADAGSPETVVVTEEEVVLRGGTSTTTWLVPHHDASVRPQRHPSANVEMLDRGAGVVWRTRITLTLARGAELTCVRSRPSERHRSALAHLTSGSSGPARRTTRTRFRVGPRGELLEVPAVDRGRTK